MTCREYIEWAPSARLAAHVACLWSGRVAATGESYTDLVLPDACVDLIFDGEHLFVAGPDTQAVSFEPRPSQTFVGIRMRPGHARILLGRPASELLDQRADLRDLWPLSDAQNLGEELAAASTCGRTADVLEAAVRRRLASSPDTDPLVDALATALRESASNRPGLVHRMAATLGATSRTLHRRCVAAVGYGPKTLDRVLRFQRARALARSAAAERLDELALAAGYADQAHLTRECKRLSGLTPSELFKTRARSGATVAS